MTETQHKNIAVRIPVTGAYMAVLSCMISFVIMQGINYQLLTLLLEHQGYSETLIGISAGMMPIGILCASVLTPYIVSKSDAIFTAVFGLSLVAISMMGLYFFRDYAVWLVLRFLLGFGISIPFIIGEAWINEMIDDKNRAKNIAFYITVISAGFAVGPVILTFTGIHGPWPFVFSGVLALFAMIPIFTYKKQLPPFNQDKDVRMIDFLPLAPVIVFGVFIISSMDQSLITFLSVYGLHNGFSEQESIIFVTILVVGTIIFQMPIGYIADKLPNRRYANVACAILSFIGFLILPNLIHQPYLFMALLLITGGISFAIYSLCITELGQRFKGSMLLAGTAVLSMAWGVSGIVSSPAVGFLMEYFHDDYLFYSIAVLFAIYTIVIWVRRDRANNSPHQSSAANK